MIGINDETRAVIGAEEYGLPRPEFLEIGDTFRTVLYRENYQKPIERADKKPIKQERQDLVLAYVKNNGRISNKEAREILTLAESTTKRILRQMVEEGLLEEQGDKKSRVYMLD